MFPYFEIVHSICNDLIDLLDVAIALDLSFRHREDGTLLQLLRVTSRLVVFLDSA